VCALSTACAAVQPHAANLANISMSKELLQHLLPAGFDVIPATPTP
jgi:hypothetical protein